jgi:hypothetical protein
MNFMMISSYIEQGKKQKQKKIYYLNYVFISVVFSVIFLLKKKEKLSCEFIFHISFSYNFFFV